MKHGGLKLLESSPGRLTPCYKTEARGGRERVSKPNITWVRGGFRDGPRSLQSRVGGSRDPTCTGSVCPDFRT